MVLLASEIFDIVAGIVVYDLMYFLKIIDLPTLHRSYLLTTNIKVNVAAIFTGNSSMVLLLSEHFVLDISTTVLLLDRLH